jgi:hypothetical protein
MALTCEGVTLFASRFAHHANDRQHCATTDTATNHLADDRTDIEPPCVASRSCQIGRPQHTKNRAPDASADNPADRVDERPLVQAAQQFACNVATNRARDKAKNKFHKSFPLGGIDLCQPCVPHP